MLKRKPRLNGSTDKGFLQSLTVCLNVIQPLVNLAKNVIVREECRKWMPKPQPWFYSSGIEDSKKRFTYIFSNIWGMKMFGDACFKLVWLGTFESTCFNNTFLHNSSQHFTQPWILIKDTMINQKWELIACEFSLRGARGLKIRIMPLVVRWIHVYTFGSSEMTAWLFCRPVCYLLALNVIAWKKSMLQ